MGRKAKTQKRKHRPALSKWYGYAYAYATPIANFIQRTKKGEPSPKEVPTNETESRESTVTDSHLQVVIDQECKSIDAKEVYKSMFKFIHE